MPSAQSLKVILYGLLDKLQTSTDDPMLYWVIVGTLILILVSRLWEDHLD